MLLVSANGSRPAYLMTGQSSIIDGDGVRIALGASMRRRAASSVAMTIAFSIAAADPPRRARSIIRVIRRLPRVRAP